jgi:hypothetical protein
LAKLKGANLWLAELRGVDLRAAIDLSQVQVHSARTGTPLSSLDSSSGRDDLIRVIARRSRRQPPPGAEVQGHDVA